MHKNAQGLSHPMSSACPNKYLIEIIANLKTILLELTGENIWRD